MTRVIRVISFSVVLWFAMTRSASAQATVEAAMGSAAATTTAAPANAAGKAISGLAANLEKVIKSGQQPSSGSSATSTTTVASTAKTPMSAALATPSTAAKWEDPGGIEKGIGYDELVRRFGPPSLEITGDTGRTAVYSSKAGVFRIQIEDEKVTSIRKPQA